MRVNQPPESLGGDQGSPYQLARTKSGYMLTFSADMVIGESLRVSGSFQEADIDHALDLLKRNGVSVPRSVFLDVGANIGTHSIYALKRGFQTAVCIEADPENFRLLKINQILNDVDARCLNICAAASAAPGEAEIELSPTNFGDHRVLPGTRREKNTHGEGDWEARKIRTDLLDRMIESVNLSPEQVSFAWIDTQGHEGHVLSGAERFLGAGIPFVAEFWPYGLERSGGWARFRTILCDGRHDIFDLRRSMEQNALVRASVDELDRSYESWLAYESLQFSPHTDLLILKSGLV